MSSIGAIHGSPRPPFSDLAPASSLLDQTTPSEISPPIDNAPGPASTPASAAFTHLANPPQSALPRNVTEGIPRNPLVRDRVRAVKACEGRREGRPHALTSSRPMPYVAA